jgi:hypothetical protein
MRTGSAALIVSHTNLAQAGADRRRHHRSALDIAEAIENKGILAPSDAWMIAELRRRLAAAN